MHAQCVVLSKDTHAYGAALTKCDALVYTNTNADGVGDDDDKFCASIFDDDTPKMLSRKRVSYNDAKRLVKKSSILLI